MAKIVKLEPDGKVKNIPAWKNRAVIDEVKADFIASHNRKIKERKGKE